MFQRQLAFPVKQLFAMGICLALVLALAGCAGGNRTGTFENTSVESDAAKKPTDDQIETYQ